MRATLAGERGAVTAEFVIVLPAAITIFGLLAGVFTLQLQQVRVFQAVAVAVREVAWGTGVPSPVDGVIFSVESEPGQSCVSARASALPPWFRSVIGGEKQCLPNLGY